MPKVPYPYEVNGKLVTGNGFLILICSLSNRFLLPSLTVYVFSYSLKKEVFVYFFDFKRKLFDFDTTFIKRIFFAFMLKLFYSFFYLHIQPFFYLFFPVFCFISKFLYSWASSFKDSPSFVHVCTLYILCSCPGLLFMVKRIVIKLVECSRY